MSLVGQFNTNSDRTTQMDGVGRSRTMSFSRRNDEQEQASQELPRHESASSEGTAHEEPITHYSQAQTDERVTELARQLSRRSTQNERYQEGSDDFIIEKDSQYDPFSENFNVKAWVRRLTGVISRDPENHPQRTAGISFRNLNVHGYGSDTGYQGTVGNMPVRSFGALKDLITGNKRKVDILKGFDGLIEAGEMLVVLGPPGS